MIKTITGGLLAGLTTVSTACGSEAILTNTWFSTDNYSLNIESEDGKTTLDLSPSLRVMPKSDEFRGALKLVLRYPLPDERLDVMVVDIFSKNKPKVELPKIRVKVAFLLMDELTEEHDFDNPLFAEGAWKTLGFYGLKPGQEKTLNIAGAANHKLVVVRSEIYDEDGKELLGRYLHGFEIE